MVERRVGERLVIEGTCAAMEDFSLPSQTAAAAVRVVGRKLTVDPSADWQTVLTPRAVQAKIQPLQFWQFWRLRTAKPARAAPPSPRHRRHRPLGRRPQLQWSSSPVAAATRPADTSTPIQQKQAALREGVSVQASQRHPENEEDQHAEQPRANVVDTNVVVKKLVLEAAPVPVEQMKHRWLRPFFYLLVAIASAKLGWTLRLFLRMRRIKR
jgi:hypothetical protein